MPPGVALLDYDNDGDLDVFLVQSQTGGSRLYRNDLKIAADGTRTLHFTDVTAASGIKTNGYGMGVADIDNDGCADLYLTSFGRNQLWRNNCDGTFTDISKRFRESNRDPHGRAGSDVARAVSKVMVN